MLQTYPLIFIFLPPCNILNSKISVLVTTYNRSSLLVRALNSIFRQSYTNIEVIVVDDCSTDNTQDVIRDYPASIIYHRHPTKLGNASSRNTAFNLVQVPLLHMDDDVVGR